MGTEYHKIPCVWKRSEDGKRVLTKAWCDPTVNYLQNCLWEFTEKMDGTNIRIVWDGYKVEILGRTDRANLPKHLDEYLHNTFATEEAEELFEQKFGGRPAVLYGEGIGEKIQAGGGLYMPDGHGCAFVLFDILVEDKWWLDYDSMANIAKTFGVSVVPIMGMGFLEDAIKTMSVPEQPKSWYNDKHPMEGIVARPIIPVLRKDGSRVIVKIKWKDFRTNDTPSGELQT